MNAGAQNPNLRSGQEPEEAVQGKRVATAACSDEADRFPFPSQAALTDELLLAIARALQAQPARDTAEAAAEELQLLRSLAAVDRFGVCLEFAGDDAKQALGARASALLPHLRGAKRKQVARELVERIESGH